jgi:hypothetical protein
MKPKMATRSALVNNAWCFCGADREAEMEPLALATTQEDKNVG